MPSTKGSPVNSKLRVEKQIRLVLAIYRVELRRRDSDEMIRFRDRAGAIFANLEASIGDDPELRSFLREARRELWPNRPSAPGGLREQAVNGGRQFGNGEGLG
jgi:hypothetical protein